MLDIPLHIQMVANLIPLNPKQILQYCNLGVKNAAVSQSLVAAERHADSFVNAEWKTTEPLIY